MLPIGAFETSHPGDDDDDDDDTKTPFELTLYPTFIKNVEPIKNFVQIGSISRKRGCFCNDDLYLLPYCEVILSQQLYS